MQIGLPVYAATNFDLEYRTISIKVNWHFGKKRNWYLYFDRYAGFLIRTKERTFGSNRRADFNTTDFDVSLGVGIKIPASTQFKISLVYKEQAGFTDVF